MAPRPSTPEAAAAIRTAAQHVLDALNELRPLIEPYHGLMDTPNDPPGIEAEHFHAYHAGDLDNTGRSLYAAIAEDLLGLKHDGFGEWYRDESDPDEDIEDEGGGF